MLLQLQSYDLECVYRGRKDLVVADALSRAYIHQDHLEVEIENDFEVMLVQSISPTRMEELQRKTSTDLTMQRLTEVIRNDWPMNEHCLHGTKPYQTKEPMKRHPTLELPWTQVSAEIFEWNGMKYLVMVNAYSGWFEVDTLHDMSSNYEASFCYTWQTRIVND